MKKFAALAFSLLAINATAATGSAYKTGSVPGALTNLSYEITASWDSPLTFELVADVYGNLGRSWYPSGDITGGLSIVTYLRSTTTANLAGPSSHSLDISIRFVDSESGEAWIPNLTQYGQVSTSPIFLSAGPAASVGVRFSSPILHRTSDFTNGQDSLTYHQTLDFTPANYLAVSDDPTCASFSCMTPMKDVVFGNNRAGFSLTITAVPEPSTYALALVGLAAVGAAWRRHTRRT